ncbi:hypothetical protein ABMA28_015182 [Loxostege sticticalis]|uniref:Uncharacterized protein n=1 Tax=Loxostege sticticalis TaxID=481309 RepID=A0ABD0TEP9_LOXSC
MDARLLIAALGALLASAAAVTVTDSPASPSTESPFVPGVFIAADALKSLQDKSKADNNGASKVSQKSDQISSSPNTNVPEQPIQGYQMPEQQMNQPGNQQYMPDQQSAYPTQPMLNQPQVYGNQPQVYGNQPQVYGNQPQVYGNQPQVYGNQPQAYGNQPQVYANQPQDYGNQQGMLLVNQQPGYQQNGLGSQPTFLNNPQYQQPILLNQQPAYQNPQGVIYSQQPLYNQQPILMPQQPTLVAQQPNRGMFIPNGQPMNPNLVGQPMISNNPGNGGLYTHPVPSQGNLYAMVPVNGQNTMQNPNLGNNNAYFVPVQQVPTNTVLLRDTARK